MNQPENLDVLQHGATARRRGLRFARFACEWVTLTRVYGDPEPVLCTPGWRGISVCLSGKTVLRRWRKGAIAEAPTRTVAVTRSHDFMSYRLLSTRASFLMIRIGRRVTRSKMVEAFGDQVASQVIEKVAEDRGRDYQQLVVSDSEAQATDSPDSPKAG